MKEKKYCKQCGKEIKSWKTFCDRYCYAIWFSTHDNPFKGKKHTKETKLKQRKAKLGKYNGKKNPFYGKKHSKETRELISKIHTGRWCGKNNFFYGKKHSEETKERIRKKNEEYRKEHADLILKRNLNNLNLTKEKLKKIFLEYKNTNITLIKLGKKYGVDNRVLQKYILFFDITTKEEFNKIKIKKKYYKSMSYQEDLLYDFLRVKFGSDNVIRQYKIQQYFFDFLLYNKFLIEYDGYYWHKEFDNNDILKNKAAENNGFKLYRVLEPESRKVDFVEEMKKIGRFIENDKTD